jgi:membrane fusion protein, multidrug efflux system
MDSPNKEQNGSSISQSGELQNSNGRKKTSAMVLEPVPIETLNKALPAEIESDVKPQSGQAEQAAFVEPSIAPVAKKKSGRKIILATALGIGAVVAGTFGYQWWQFASVHESTDNAAVTGHVYQISSRVSGRVLTVPVDDNQVVKAGQLLVQIDPKDYQVKVQQAQAAIAVAQKQAEAAQGNISLAGANTQAQTAEAQGNVSSAIASISTAQAAVTEAQAGVPAAQADLAQANANLQKLQADYNRYSALYQEGAIAKQQLDSAKAAYDVAVAQRNSAQQGINQAQAKLTQAQEGVTNAQAQLAASKGGLQKAQAGGVQTEVNRSQYAAANAAIAQAQANLAEAQLQLSYTNVTAPEGGRVGRKTVEVGNQVQAGQPLMAVVGNDLWVTANFKETQVHRMHPNERVEVELDAFPGHKFEGRVNSLSPASGSQFALLPPDNATGNFTKVVQRIPVKVALDPNSVKGYESQITPGMSAIVTVEVK